MKVAQSTMMSPELAKDAENLGMLLARLRHARGVKQHEAALRAGISRNSAYRMERGDPGLAIGQILRYLEAIAPGGTLLELLSQTDPSPARTTASTASPPGTDRAPAAAPGRDVSPPPRDIHVGEPLEVVAPR